MTCRKLKAGYVGYMCMEMSIWSCACLGHTKWKSIPCIVGIMKRWQEYTEELYKKDLHDPDNYDVITHLEPDILECEVKWALVSITMNKASGCDGIPVELFQILKRWCCERAALNMPANLENSAVATGLEKVSFHSSPKERQCQRMLKLPYNFSHFTH